MTRRQVDAIFEMPVKLTGASALLTDEALDLAHLINSSCPEGHAKLNAIGKLQEALHMAIAAIATA